MALIKCPECGKEISDNAENCPHCGYPIKPKTPFDKKRIAGIAGVAIIALVIIIIVVMTNRLTPEEQVEVNKAISAINEIGEVTLNSKQTIEDADIVYNGLSDKCKKHVDNYKDLSTAKETYDLLRAQAVIELIDDIDSSNVTEQESSKIQNADFSYNALSEDQKKLVTNYEKLSSDKDELLKNKINEVVTSIDKIGEVNLDSKDKINTAKTLFDKLSSDEQTLVSNSEKLISAEKEFGEIAVSNCIKLIDSIGDVTLDSETKITAARDAYKELDENLKQKVSNSDELESAYSYFKELKEEEDINSKTIYPDSFISSSKWEVTYKRAKITDRILPKNTSGFYMYYTANENSTFVDLIFDIKNIDSRMIAIDSVVNSSCKVDYKGGTVTKNCELFLDQGTNLDKIYSWDGLDSLDTCTLHIVLSMPREIETNDEAIRVKLTIAGKEKYINVRGYDKAM